MHGSSIFQKMYDDGYKDAVEKAKQWLCANCIKRCTCQLPKEECGRLMSFLKELEYD